MTRFSPTHGLDPPLRTTPAPGRPRVRHFGTRSMTWYHSPVQNICLESACAWKSDTLPSPVFFCSFRLPRGSCTLCRPFTIGLPGQKHRGVFVNFTPLCFCPGRPLPALWGNQSKLQTEFLSPLENRTAIRTRERTFCPIQALHE